MRHRLLVRGLHVLALVFAWLALAGPARAQFDLVPGYDDRPLLGPVQARGAVIWNHGKSGDGRDMFGETPYAMDALRDSGWDVYRLHRKGTADGEESGTRALIREAQALKARGYRHIVSAGQSFGGWISYLAATRTQGLFHAIIAVAPAAHGEAGVSHNWSLNADRLYAMARDLKPTRVMSFFFLKDGFDPGGRGTKLDEILGAKGLPRVMVDQRPGLEGHGAGRTLAFGRSYGECMRDFLEAAVVPAKFACRSDPVVPRLEDFVLPADVEPDPDPPLLAKPFVGRWFGSYVHGRQLMLIVREVDEGGVTAVYAWSPQYRRADEKPGYQIRRGRLDSAAGKLIFEEPKRPRLEFALKPDGGLDVTWTRQDGKVSTWGSAHRLQ